VAQAKVRWKATRRNSKAKKKRLLYRTMGASIYVAVDPASSIEESDETNNAYSRLFKVLSPPKVRIPETTFIRLEKKGDNPDSLTITASVTNSYGFRKYGYYLNDHADATDVEVKFFDGKPGGKKQIGADQIVDRLKPLEFRNVSVDWDISRLKGKHTIYVQAFPGKNVIEALGRKRTYVTSITIDLDAYRYLMAEK
jgi:subtilase family serine protease